jgi:lipopolysaccharide biosynthesis protein
MVLKAAKGLNYNIFDTSTPAKNYLIFSFKKMKPFEANIYKYIVMNFHQNNTRQNRTQSFISDSKIKGVGGGDDSLVFQNNMHQESFLPISSSQSVKVDCYTLIFAITMLLLKY